MSQGEVISILIVDDETETRASLNQLLSSQSEFVVVATACDGREAVELVGKLKPDVIVMDIDMPDMDGLEATKQIIKHDSDAKVILMSDDARSEIYQQAMLAGSKWILSRGADKELLSKSIRIIHTTQYPIIRHS